MRGIFWVAIAASAGAAFVHSTPTYSQAISEILRGAPLTSCDTYAALPDPKWKASGVPLDKIDPDLAIPACESAVRHYPNSTRLLFQLGRAYNKKGDYQPALTFYRKAAEQGYAPAQYSLAAMYERSQGIKEDDSQAIALYRKAANQGFAPAQFNLGVMYYKGQGVSRDIAESLVWLRKAAEQGYISACLSLGRLYATGQSGTVDYGEAVKWFRVAAEQGNADGQTNLGIMYEFGHGVPSNLANAAEWYRKAALQGDTDARNRLTALEVALAAGRAANSALQAALASGKPVDQAWKEAELAAGRAARETELAAGGSVEIAKRVEQQAANQISAQAPTVRSREQTAVPPVGDVNARKQTTEPSQSNGVSVNPYHGTDDDFNHDWTILNESGQRFVTVGAQKYSISGWDRSLDVTLRDLSSATASVIINSACNHPTELHLQWSLRVYLVDGTLAGQCKLTTAIQEGLIELQRKLREEPWRLKIWRVMGINLNKGPMPPLSPAEKRCQETLDRAASRHKSDDLAFKHELDQCMENLRQEWLAQHPASKTETDSSGKVTKSQRWVKITADNGAGYVIDLGNTKRLPNSNTVATVMCQADVDGRHCVGGRFWQVYATAYWFDCHGHYRDVTHFSLYATWQIAPPYSVIGRASELACKQAILKEHQPR